MDSSLQYQIALTLIPGVGVKLAKNLVAHCGSPQAVFKEKKQALLSIPGIGNRVVKAMTSAEVLKRAEKEIFFIEKEHIKPLFYLDEAYPKRLKLCDDGPVMLFQKGSVDINKHHVLAVVGTRNATEYGKSFCKDFIEALKPYNVIVLSGLAYGIDVAAHKEAVNNKVPTIAVLGHGLDRVYPSAHRKIAESMLAQNGALVTEYLSETNPDRENFPKRNRIIAGIADALIVVEAAHKGGALITAEIANTYNRDVFAVPGRLTDKFSEGCNMLIKNNKAALIKDIKDLNYILGWEETKINKDVQKRMFIELNEFEQKIFKALEEKPLELDVLCYKLEAPVSKVLGVLMEMELNGILKNFPGRIYGLA